VPSSLRALSTESLVELQRFSEATGSQGRRRVSVEKFGYDVKFAYHVVRLCDECEQILTTGDLDLERSKEVLKAIRRGEWTEQQVRDYFTAKEPQLERMYAESTLPWGPDEGRIKALLLQCLEHHYGSLDRAIVVEGSDAVALREIEEALARHRQRSVLPA
jgi:hypothetical protein